MDEGKSKLKWVLELRWLDGWKCNLIESRLKEKDVEMYVHSESEHEGRADRRVDKKDDKILKG